MQRIRPALPRRTPLFSRMPGTELPRPFRELLTLLPLIPTSEQGELDWEAAEPDVLVRLADAAEMAQRVINLGVSAIGNLLAYAAPEIETGEVSANTVEALAWLLAELGDGAAVCFELSAPCRQHTADYTGA
ncbi:hypothetical protein BH10PSE16_BH10PSE16_38840 [soil metagenome]